MGERHDGARGDLPLSWQTWQGPNAQPASTQSTPWLFRGSDTGNYNSFPINESGLAQEILKADPNARVLAFSWIDESATPTGIFGIPKDAFQSEGHTTMAGMQMAQATMEALAPTYFLGSGKVHMIGHSHGSARRDGRGRRAAAGRPDELQVQRGRPAHRPRLARRQPLRVSGFVAKPDHLPGQARTSPGSISRNSIPRRSRPETQWIPSSSTITSPTSDRTSATSTSRTKIRESVSR